MHRTRVIPRVAFLASFLIPAVAAAPGPAVASAPAPALPSAPTRSDTLSFDVPASDGAPAGWRVPEAGVVSLDSAVVHGGRYSVRIRRDAHSPQAFSAIVRTIARMAEGDSLVLSGWLRTEGVVGSAGLWLREDAAGGSVQFDNMENRELDGTTPWTRYRVVLACDRRARSVSFGVLLSGTGTVYADDLDLRADDVPFDEAPPRSRTAVAFDTDREFDSGSRIDIASLPPDRAANVALLVRVWGFVKYRHPRAAAGAIHMDYELFRSLPAVLAARSAEDARRAIVRWLDRLGEPPPCAPCAAPPESVVVGAPIAWIRDRGLLGRDLSARLERIEERRSDGTEGYYASFPSGLVPDFSGEVPFDAAPLPDAGQRLLAVARLWNIVEYWFPYRDTIPGDWEGTLAEFLPRVVLASDPDAYRRVLMEFVARIGDGHATVWDAWKARPPAGACEAALALRPVGGRFVFEAVRDSALARESGLEPGDVLVGVDGSPVDSIVAADARFYSGSNEAARRRNIAFGLTRGSFGPCRFEVERAGRRLEVASRRDSTSRFDPQAGRSHELPGEAFRLLTPEVAYLRISEAKNADAASYVERAAGTRCFVADLRGYPTAYIPFTLAGHFVDAATPFTRITAGDPANPGAFVWSYTGIVPPLTPRYAGRLVILVDEATMSAAEYAAMSLRVSPGAIVVGSTTAGADGNVTRIQLPGGVITYMSGLGIYDPDGRPTQHVGIVPDVEANATAEGIRRREDVVLEAALRRALGHDVSVPIRP